MNIQAKHALAALQAMNELSQCKLKLKLATDVALNLETLRTFQRAFNTSQTQLLEEHGTENEKHPGSFKIEPEKIKVFNEKMDELMDEEVTLDMRPLKMNQLPDDLEVTPACVAGLKHVSIE